MNTQRASFSGLGDREFAAYERMSYIISNKTDKYVLKRGIYVSFSK